MKSRAALFIPTVMAIIIGSKLYKQFDFENLTFEHNGLAIIYNLTFLLSVFFIIKNIRDQSKV